MFLRARVLATLAFVLVGCASRTSNTPEPTTAEGQALADSVHEAVKEHSVPIHHCYEKELKARPDLKGRVVLEWDIAPSGFVSRIVTRESFDKSVDNCLIDVIQEIKFKPTSNGNVGRIIYPFEFGP